MNIPPSKRAGPIPHARPGENNRQEHPPNTLPRTDTPYSTNGGALPAISQIIDVKKLLGDYRELAGKDNCKLLSRNPGDFFNSMLEMKNSLKVTGESIAFCLMWEQAGFGEINVIELMPFFKNGHYTEVESGLEDLVRAGILEKGGSGYSPKLIKDKESPAELIEKIKLLARLSNGENFAFLDREVQIRTIMGALECEQYARPLSCYRNLIDNLKNGFENGCRRSPVAKAIYGEAIIKIIAYERWCVTFSVQAAALSKEQWRIPGFIEEYKSKIKNLNQEAEEVGLPWRSVIINRMDIKLLRVAFQEEVQGVIHIAIDGTSFPDGAKYEFGSECSVFIWDAKNIIGLLKEVESGNETDLFHYCARMLAGSLTQPGLDNIFRLQWHRYLQGQLSPGKDTQKEIGGIIKKKKHIIYNRVDEKAAAEAITSKAKTDLPLFLESELTDDLFRALLVFSLLSPLDAYHQAILPFLLECINELDPKSGAVSLNPESKASLKGRIQTTIIEGDVNGVFENILRYWKTRTKLSEERIEQILNQGEKAIPSFLLELSGRMLIQCGFVDIDEIRKDLCEEFEEIGLNAEVPIGGLKFGGRSFDSGAKLLCVARLADEGYFEIVEQGMLRLSNAQKEEIEKNKTAVRQEILSAIAPGKGISWRSNRSGFIIDGSVSNLTSYPNLENGREAALRILVRPEAPLCLPQACWVYCLSAEMLNMLESAKSVLAVVGQENGARSISFYKNEEKPENLIFKDSLPENMIGRVAEGINKAERPKIEGHIVEGAIPREIEALRLVVPYLVGMGITGIRVSDSAEGQNLGTAMFSVKPETLQNISAENAVLAAADIRLSREDNIQGKIKTVLDLYKKNQHPGLVEKMSELTAELPDGHEEKLLPAKMEALKRILDNLKEVPRNKLQPILAELLLDGGHDSNKVYHSSQATPLSEFDQEKFIGIGAGWVFESKVCVSGEYITFNPNASDNGKKLLYVFSYDRKRKYSALFDLQGGRYTEHDQFKKALIPVEKEYHVNLDFIRERGLQEAKDLFEAAQNILKLYGNKKNWEGIGMRTDDFLFYGENVVLQGLLEAIAPAIVSLKGANTSNIFKAAISAVCLHGDSKSSESAEKWAEYLKVVVRAGVKLHLQDLSKGNGNPLLTWLVSIETRILSAVEAEQKAKNEHSILRISAVFNRAVPELEKLSQTEKLELITYFVERQAAQAAGGIAEISEIKETTLDTTDLFPTQEGKECCEELMQKAARAGQIFASMDELPGIGEGVSKAFASAITALKDNIAGGDAGIVPPLEMLTELLCAVNSGRLSTKITRIRDVTLDNPDNKNTKIYEFSWKYQKSLTVKLVTRRSTNNWGEARIGFNVYYNPSKKGASAIPLGSFRIDLSASFGATVDIDATGLTDALLKTRRGGWHFNGVFPPELSIPENFARFVKYFEGAFKSRFHGKIVTV